VEAERRRGPEIGDQDVRRHSIFAQLLADPMTRQAFKKPRGYPGDADLIDLIYGSEPAVAALDAASPIGLAWDDDFLASLVAA
jgi:extracellular factor (EF) 3-hydroxypalmitic acid methyl ester biosynthesis protein